MMLQGLSLTEWPYLLHSRRYPPSRCTKRRGSPLRVTAVEENLLDRAIEQTLSRILTRYGIVPRSLADKRAKTSIKKKGIADRTE